MMRVSVVIPVYNTGRWLEPCLQSVAAIDYPDLEVIVVDDGSTDGSAAVCDRFAPLTGWRVIHTANQGVSTARNLGVVEATGEYIAFVDADDMVHPRYIDILVSIMTSAGAKTAMCRFTTDRGKLGKGAESQRRLAPKVYSCTEAIERTLYQRGCDSSLCCKLLSRKALLEAPQRPLRYEDLDAIYRIYEAAGGNVASTDAILYYYRENPQSFINTFAPDRLDVLRVTAEIEDHYAENPSLLKAARERRFSANYNMYLLCRKASKSGQGDTDEIKRQCAECRKLIRTYRREILFNPRVRPKSRIGALLAYFL